MPDDLTIYEVREVKQLLSFKTADLVKSRLFTKTISSNQFKDILENDIELSCGEIEDLENILIAST
ncbi:hypothetical protein FQV26_01435 [Planococcus sp. CPCC 101016]|uniref:hypothetical protein n=1 Tax=Planococcus sp. CPCC 101016 TaxID=2599617 RepID=UPI0011B6972B|nr:hypothetical protein [Planococcus sp. CPCC 101016]TWT06504.1 hypothetical protein FQV26_01435 [Planococcus sp. CPCC 101016]